MGSAVPCLPVGPAAKETDRIKPGEYLYIRGEPSFEMSPIDGPYRVEPGGEIVLGPVYGGRVKVEGRTLEEAEKLLRTHLLQYLRKVEVSVARYTVPTADERLLSLEREVKALRAEVKELREAVRELTRK